MDNVLNAALRLDRTPTIRLAPRRTVRTAREPSSSATLASIPSLAHFQLCSFPALLISTQNRRALRPETPNLPLFSGGTFARDPHQPRLRTDSHPDPRSCRARPTALRESPPCCPRSTAGVPANPTRPFCWW